MKMLSHSWSCHQYVQRSWCNQYCCSTRSHEVSFIGHREVAIVGRGGDGAAVLGGDKGGDAVVSLSPSAIIKAAARAPHTIVRLSKNRVVLARVGKN